jgi:hypothetical protein
MKALGAPVDLFRRHIFDVGCHRPNMAEGIFQRAGAVAIELILQRANDFGSRIDGLLKALVNILQVEEEYLPASRRALQGLRNPILGISSASMMTELPILISAWPILTRRCN